MEFDPKQRHGYKCNENTQLHNHVPVVCSKCGRDFCADCAKEKYTKICPNCETDMSKPWNNLMERQVK